MLQPTLMLFKVRLCLRISGIFPSFQFEMFNDVSNGQSCSTREKSTFVLIGTDEKSNVRTSPGLNKLHNTASSTDVLCTKNSIFFRISWGNVEMYWMWWSTIPVTHSAAYFFAANHSRVCTCWVGMSCIITRLLKDRKQAIDENFCFDFVRLQNCLFLPFQNSLFLVLCSKIRRQYM